MQRTLSVLAAVALAVGCGAEQSETQSDSMPPTTGASAAPDSAALAASSIDVPVKSAGGADLGTLSIAETSSGLRISGTLRGLPPGTHGIHLHAAGQCEPPFTSAGGHWNPAGRQHGTDNPNGPHLGDLPNLTVDADSSVAVLVNSTGGTLRGDNPLLDADGAAIVVHAGPDDYRTDPSGSSGDRIACGVVRGG